MTFEMKYMNIFIKNGLHDKINCKSGKRPCINLYLYIKCSVELYRVILVSKTKVFFCKISVEKSVYVGEIVGPCLSVNKVLC